MRDGGPGGRAECESAMLTSTEFSLFIFMEYFQAGCDILKMLPYLPDLKFAEVNGKISINRDTMTNLGGSFGFMDWTQGSLCK